MLPNGHKIADARFKIAFASPDEAIRGAARLPGLIQKQLVPCMEKVFNRWGADPEVVRIDRLAVDLGTVGHEDMARGLARRLEQALHAALQERLGAELTSGAKAVRRIPPHQACLEPIAHYLQTGTVPWMAEKSSADDLNRLLETAIDQAPQILVEFLQSKTQTAGPVLPRLTRQFKPDLLLRLAARLAPAAAPTLNRLVSALADLHLAAASAPAADRQWVGALWEDILGQLLSPGGRSMAPYALVANALLAAAARYNISHRRLYRRLTRAWQRHRTTAADSAAEQLIAQVLQQLAPENAYYDASQPTTAPWASLKSKLLDAVIHHRMDGFDKAWPVMLTYFAGPTRQVIRQTARQSQVRRTIARRFAPRQFRQLVVLLEPRNARFINNVLEHQKTLGQAMPRASTTPETMRVHIREFTLAYLLSEGATRFNRQQYCAGVIRGLAARHNMAYEALLEDIHTFFANAVAAGDDTGRRLKEILDEICANPGGTQTPPPQEGSPPPGISGRRPARMRAVPAPSTAQRHGLDSEETNTSMASDASVLQEIRAVLGRDIRPSCLTAALRRLAARHPRWSRLLTQALLEMERDLDPTDLIRHLARCLQKTEGANTPSAFYQALCRELASVGPLPQASDKPSDLSEKASRQNSSKNQTMAPDNPVAKEIRAVLGRDIRLSGLTASLRRLAGRHPRWSRLLTHALLEMGRDLDPADLIRHLARCLQKTGGATAPSEFYQKLRRELTALRPLPHATVGPSKVSETACCQCPSENQTMALDGSLPEDIRAVLGRDITLSGLTAALKRLAGHHPRWSRFLFHALLETGRDLDPAALMQHLRRCLENAGGATAPGAFYRKLHRELSAGRFRTHAVDGPPAQMAGGRRKERETSSPVSSQNRWIWRKPEAAAPDQSVFVQNAGLVLVAPYLPKLFGMLCLTAKKRFNNHPAAERAVHLLEFIANERTAAPEFQLALNKILCGVAVSTPIISGIDITPTERSAVDSLIRSIIEHWKILGNTSPEGLRTTFLQREGYLALKDDAWHLRVEQGSFDILLDRLPWSYAVIKHPWMTRILYVNWRSS